MVDMTNPGPAPIDLTLRVHDRKHNNLASDRLSRNFHMAPATRSALAIPLTEAVGAPQGRILEIADIALLMTFAGTDAALASQEFYLTRIWLECA
jgi:hypothetical protein